jgi:CDP-paratose 2-epimerase
MSKSILITGGAGFVGSSLALLLKKYYPHYEIFAMDNLKRRGSELNIPRLQKNGVKFFHGDIRNKEDFDSIPVIDTLIEASAEPSVLAGLDSTPDYLVNTNLIGTINCLNFATKHKADFIFLSTSRVYPIAEIEKINFEEAETRFNILSKQTINGISPKGLNEDFPLNGYRSLYGATKLSAELMIQEYGHFYGIKTVINRCGVITGPWQMGKADQGVVVLWMAKHYWKQPLSYIGYGGTGKQVRDILHVNDLYSLVDYEMHNMEKNNRHIYNVGGGSEVSISLKELTIACEKLTGNKIPVQQVKENRAADIRIYITDNSKVTSATGWKPETGVDQIMEDVYKWIKNNENQLQYILK